MKSKNMFFFNFFLCLFGKTSLAVAYQWHLIVVSQMIFFPTLWVVLLLPPFQPWPQGFLTNQLCLSDGLVVDCRFFCRLRHHRGGSESHPWHTPVPLRRRVGRRAGHEWPASLVFFSWWRRPASEKDSIGRDVVLTCLEKQAGKGTCLCVELKGIRILILLISAASQSPWAASWFTDRWKRWPQKTHPGYINWKGFSLSLEVATMSGKKNLMRCEAVKWWINDNENGWNGWRYVIFILHILPDQEIRGLSYLCKSPMQWDGIMQPPPCIPMESPAMRILKARDVGKKRWSMWTCDIPSHQKDPKR